MAASALNYFMCDQPILAQILSALQAALQPIQPYYVDAIDSHHSFPDRKLPFALSLPSSLRIILLLSALCLSGEI